MRESSRFLYQFGCAGIKKLQHWRLTVLASFGEKSPFIAGWNRVSDQDERDFLFSTGLLASDANNDPDFIDKQAALQ
jgi:hypothetical protein